LFKCAEIISATSNWITMVELKLASDDDTYLDEAVEENKSYTVRTVFIIVRENKGSKVELIPIKAVLF